MKKIVVEIIFSILIISIKNSNLLSRFQLYYPVFYHKNHKTDSLAKPNHSVISSKKIVRYSKEQKISVSIY